MKVFDSKRTALAPLFLTLLAFLAILFALPSKTALAAQQEERPLLMIVVGFGEGGGGSVPYNNVYDWNEALFSGEESLAAYYRDQSQGLFSLVPVHENSAYNERRNTNRADRADDGVVHVNLDSTHRAWGLVNQDVNVKNDFTHAVADSLDAARSFVDFDAYDANGDERITPDELIVIVCTSGYDASGLNQAEWADLPLLWPHSGTIDGATEEADDSKTLPNAYLAIAENFIREGEAPSEAQREPVGIIAHELGHCLGLPDLYAFNDASEQGEWAAYKVGNLSLMAKGAWAQVLDDQRGWIFLPTSLDPWSLVELGWCDPLVAEEGDYHLHSRGSSEGYNALIIPTANPDQYFLLENRQPNGWDAALGNASANDGSRGGIVIWHIDSGICKRFNADGHINDANHRPGIMPVFFERDGSGTFSSNWAATTPDLELPFFSMTSVIHSFGDANAHIELPLYGSDDSVDAPAKRTHSGISIQVLSESGEDMVVRVKQANDAEEASMSSAWKPPLALVACLVALCVAVAVVYAMGLARRSSQRK